MQTIAPARPPAPPSGKPVPLLLLAPPLPPLRLTITPDTPQTPGMLGTGKSTCADAQLAINSNAISVKKGLNIIRCFSCAPAKRAEY
ncbi:hypothetical protein CJD36_000645 [Flavipsychrobacter stenotrophus]|uniref:Uncharacterized protein n=1 Tax=Flavipsychrobacter stenotrophus TaxID=2077091 RepID=A0A2S7SZC1_9BACT|nr:hypothetical protein CJD36_000645 [Flavipsychrobacter stenotrophus]